MNRTKNDWADYRWNPITGCWGPGGTAEKPNRCSYCYAVGLQKRFGHVGLSDPFRPIFYPERLSEPTKVKKPSKIFVCSMADLMGDWVPNEWIDAVLNRIQRADYYHHIYQLLTKNPKRYLQMVTRNGTFPSNCWVGTTITNQADADKRIPELLDADARVKFVSAEPLLGKIDLSDYLCGCVCEIPGDCPCYEKIDWLIVGAMTGPGAVKPSPAWIESLVSQCRAAGVPVFLKNNLHPYYLQWWPQNAQEWPKNSPALGAK